MITKKDRRHSGRKVDTPYHPEQEPYEKEYWSDWDDYRDSQRTPLTKDDMKILAQIRLRNKKLSGRHDLF